MMSEFVKVRIYTERYTLKLERGSILPSVDHLLRLSELFGVHMEELLVKTTARKECPEILCYMQGINCNRIQSYYSKWTTGRASA